MEGGGIVFTMDTLYIMFINFYSGCISTVVVFLLTDPSEKWLNITRMELFRIIQDSNRKKFEEKYEYLETHLITRTKCPEENQREFRRHLSRFKAQFRQRWIAARYSTDIFIKKNAEWLAAAIKVPIFAPDKRGRPEMSFELSSERSKRRKTEELRRNKSPEELSFAAQMSLRKVGQVDAASVIKDVTATTPTRASKYKKSIKQPFAEQDQISPLRALSLFVEGDFTRRQYNLIRQTDKSRFPCYSVLQKAKMECYPARESYTVTSTCAGLELQPLLDHTAQRLCMSLSEVLERLTIEEMEHLQLISKWGCDGSQQSQYKQKLGSETYSDANIFQSSFVYLQLVSEMHNQKNVIWQNPTPSSSRYCRPIRIRFVHETTDITNEEVQYVENKITSLQRTGVQTPSGLALVEHKLLFTMIDGKVCNAVTGTKYTQRCYICGATSKEFNNLNVITKTAVKPENLRFGLSILHARIRFFESILHLAYKLPVKEWQVKKNSSNAKICDDRKDSIIKAFKEQMGLLVDMPKAGFGNTNDGNTSRRFFSDIEKASDITGIDKRLIHRYKIILETVSSGLDIDVQKFSNYALDTAKLYVELYGWYPMPPTVHKILLHGAAVIESAILPVGQLSEEAAEARNKHFRQYRLGFSRKFSREECNQDILNRLLLRSDPLLTGMRPSAKKSTKPFSKETIEMLLPAKIPIEANPGTSTTVSSDDEDLEESDLEEECDFSD